MRLMKLFSRSEPAAAATTEVVERKRPSLPLRRMMARLMESAFSAANTDRLTASWPASPVPADWIITKHQRILVARSRQQCTENPYARQFLRMCRQNIVGGGVKFQAQALTSSGKLDKALNDALEEAWKEWGKPTNCDVAGKRSWLKTELSAVQAAAKDGEFMFLVVRGEDAGPWGFALQYLDPQRCPVDYDVDRYTPSTFIRHGIEFNRRGRALFYHLSTTDEGESDYAYGGRHFIRIPAADIIHGYRDELGGQKRGLPWIATGLAKLRHIGGVEGASVVNARVGASKMGFIEWENGHGPEAEDELDLEIDADPGTFAVLPEGAKLNKWDPQFPSGEAAPFLKHVLRSTAAGWGVLYNNLANDLEGVNFSSIRQGTLDERERWKEDQDWLVEDLHQKVYAAWLPIALLSGRVKVRGQAVLDVARCSRVDWMPRRWTWIDPGADVKAAVDSKNNLLKSPGAIIREGGEDPSAVYREIAQDIEEMKAAGIPDEYIKLAFGQKLNPSPQKEKQEPAAA